MKSEQVAVASPSADASVTSAKPSGAGFSLPASQNASFPGLVHFDDLRRFSAAEVAHQLISVLAEADAYRHVVADVQMMLTLAEGLGGQLPNAQVQVTERARTLMQRVEIERAVRHSVLAEGTYSAAEVGDLLGSAGKNRRDKASRLRQSGYLLGVEVAGSVLYPAFQFDASRASLRPGVAPTNQALNAKGDSWAVASWWLSPHARLDEGVRPADLALASDDSALAQLVAALRTD